MSFEAPSAVSPTWPSVVPTLPLLSPPAHHSDPTFQPAAGPSLLAEALFGSGLPQSPGEAMANLPPQRLSIEPMGSYGLGEPMPMPISPLGPPGGGGDSMLFSPLIADIGGGTPGQPRGGLGAAIGDIGPSPRVSYSSTGSGPAASAAASAMAISPRVSLTGMLPMSVAPHSGRPVLYRVPRGLLSPLISPSVSVTPSPPVPATLMASPSSLTGGGSGGVGSGRDGVGSGAHGSSLPPRPRRSRSPSVGRTPDGSAGDFMRVGSDVMAFMPSNSLTEAVAADSSFLCDTVAVALPDPVETSLTPELLASIGPSGVPLPVPSPPALGVPSMPPSSLSPTRPQPPSPPPLPPLPLPPLRAPARPTSQPPPPVSSTPALPPLPLPPLRAPIRPALQSPPPLAPSPSHSLLQPPLSPTPPSLVPSLSRHLPPPPSPSPSSYTSRRVRSSRQPSPGSTPPRRQQRCSAPPPLPAGDPMDTKSAAAPTSTATATARESGVELRYAAAAEAALARQRHVDPGSADAEVEAAAALSAMGGSTAGQVHGAIGPDLVEMTDRFSRQHVGGEAQQQAVVADVVAPQAASPSRQGGGVFPAIAAVPKSSGSYSHPSTATPSADGPSSERTGGGAISSGLGDTESVSAHAEQCSSQLRVEEGATVAGLASRPASLESAAAPAPGATAADAPGTTAALTSGSMAGLGSRAARGAAPPSTSETEWEEGSPPSGLCTRCGHAVPPCALCGSMQMDMKRLYRAVADAQAEASTLRAELKVAELRIWHLKRTHRRDDHAMVTERGRPPESPRLVDSGPLGSSVAPLASHAEAAGGHERRRVPPAHAATQRGIASAAPPSPLPPSVTTTDGVPDRLEDVWKWLGAPHPPPVEVPLPDTPKAQMLLAKNAKAHPCARSPCNSVDGHFSHILATAHHYINKRAQEAQEAMGICRGRFSDLKEALEEPGGPKVEWPFGMFNKLTNAIVKERKEVAKYTAKAAETDAEIEDLESGKVVMSDAAARSLRALASRYKLTAARGQAKVDDCTAYLFQLGCNVTYTCFIGVSATAASRAASSSAQQAFGSGGTVSAATAVVNAAAEEGGVGNAGGSSSGLAPSSRPASRPTSRPTSLPMPRTTSRPTSLPTSRTKARPVSRPSSRPTSGTYSIASLKTPTTTAADITMSDTVGDSLEDVSLGLDDRATSHIDTPRHSLQESDIDAHAADDEKEESMQNGRVGGPVEAAAAGAPPDDVLRPARPPTPPLPSRIPVARRSTSGIPLRRADRTWRGVGDPAVTAAVAAAAAASSAADEQRRPYGPVNDRRGWSTSTPRRAADAAAAACPSRRAFTPAQRTGAAAVTMSRATAAVTAAATAVIGAAEVEAAGAARCSVRGAAEKDEAPSVKRRRSRPSDPRLVKRVPQESDTDPTDAWVVDQTGRPPQAAAGGHDPDLLPCRWE